MPASRTFDFKLPKRPKFRPVERVLPSRSGFMHMLRRHPPTPIVSESLSLHVHYVGFAAGLRPTNNGRIVPTELQVIHAKFIQAEVGELDKGFVKVCLAPDFLLVRIQFVLEALSCGEVLHPVLPLGRNMQDLL